jgi:hypothetical protein
MFSHSIRGKWGADATQAQIAENNQKAIEFGRWLRLYFPQVEWYVPAEHDEFVTKAYVHLFLTEEQILKIDCMLIEEADGCMFYMPDDHLSRGMAVEKQFCNDIHKPQLNLTASMLEHNEMMKFTIINWLERIENE